MEKRWGNMSPSSIGKLLGVLCLAVQESCGIVNGREAGADECPYFARLVDEEGGMFGCGGSLIDPCFVLTSAHCMNETNKPHAVVVGANNLSNTNETHRVMSWIIHPDFNDHTFYADIALLRLFTCVETISPIQIAESYTTNDYSIENGTSLEVHGFGQLSSGGTPDVLHTVDLEFIERDYCKEIYNRNGYNPPVIPATDAFCAGYENGVKDAANGDGGGPLVFTNSSTNSKIQVGIVSWGMETAQADNPGIYTSVVPYKDWILQTFCGELGNADTADRHDYICMGYMLTSNNSMVWIVTVSALLAIHFFVD